MTGKKGEEVLLDTLCSLPYALMHIVGATYLPSKDRLINKCMKLESLDLQEKQIKVVVFKLLAYLILLYVFLLKLFDTLNFNVYTFTNKTLIFV